MNRERLRAHLISEESCNLKRHDVSGVPHIGYGRNLQGKGLSDAELQTLSYEDEDDIQQITQAQADYLFDNDVADAIKDAQAACPAFHALSDLRQEVIISMAYNLGRVGLGKFRRMHAALDIQDYDEAAKQMLDSAAAKHQAPARYKRLAEAMRTDNADALELADFKSEAEAPEAEAPEFTKADMLAFMEANYPDVFDEIKSLIDPEPKIAKKPEVPQRPKPKVPIQTDDKKWWLPRAKDKKLIQEIEATVKTITAQRLLEAYRDSPFALLEDPFGAKQAIRVLDAEFYAVPIHVWEGILSLSDFDKIQWDPHQANCANITAAAAMVVGIRYGVSVGWVDNIDECHSCGVALVYQGAQPNLEISLQPIEFQTDKILFASDLKHTDGYKIQKGTKGTLEFR